ncbi:FeoA family protein [Methanocaldococcus villosus KIN24-T80]|uniref:FeoA family protein n=1 Tax=Methanocaldococcus villosus KIN24-T80 TaxID=1069083 RepID=N6VST9_9EURY|nr:FeoA domain-containing protein [Methanocaldococcus villosus]ENN96266.1 FeoA family protein [Methanocaldococcus villosus KIN24-T80]
MMSLADVEEGKVVVIKDILAGHGLKNRLQSMGLVIGDKVKVLKNSHGPVIVENRGVKIALGRGVAMKIIVGDIK